VAAKRATLRDVAAASGVSRAAAGFALSDSPRVSVSEATRERVRQAALELGYAPHGIARALREGSSRIVVLLVESGMEGNYARTYIRGLDSELAARGHVLLVRHGMAAGSSTQHVLDAVAPRAVLRFGENYLKPGHELDDGGWNGGLAGNTLVQLRYLVSRGHSCIALALPEGDPPLGPVRGRFAAEAAEMLEIPVPRYLSVPADRAAAASAIRAFRAAHDSVTAVAAFDDEAALRVIAAAADLGLTVPDDLAVIGFDDTEYGALSTPALTTVHINAEEHGRKTARLILSLDAGGFTAAPAEVIVRQSA
jgi:DNA-binding LacI/PurR family transcriptional regulator